MSNPKKATQWPHGIPPVVLTTMRREWFDIGRARPPMAITSRNADDLAASLRRTRLALLGLAVLAAAVVTTAAWLARERGFDAGVTAAEEQIEETVGEAYRLGRRDALEAAYTCRGVAI